MVLRWLAECTQERLTHPLPVTKACLSRDDLDRVTSRLHHQTSGFNAKPLDCLCGRLTRFLTKHTAELTRTEPSRFGQPLDRQIARQVFARVGECHLNAV